MLSFSSSGVSSTGSLHLSTASEVEDALDVLETNNEGISRVHVSSTYICNPDPPPIEATNVQVRLYQSDKSNSGKSTRLPLSNVAYSVIMYANDVLIVQSFRALWQRDRCPLRHQPVRSRFLHRCGWTCQSCATEFLPFRSPFPVRTALHRPTAHRMARRSTENPPEPICCAWKIWYSATLPWKLRKSTALLHSKSHLVCSRNTIQNGMQGFYCSKFWKKVIDISGYKTWEYILLKENSSLAPIFNKFINEKWQQTNTNVILWLVFTVKSRRTKVVAFAVQRPRNGSLIGSFDFVGPAI